MNSWEKILSDKKYKNNKHQHFSLGKNEIENQPVWHSGILQGDAAMLKC